MADLRSPRVIYLKGGLFLVLGLLSAGLLLLEAPSLRVALLLGLAVWAFCRAYYFAFYVVQRYVDPAYRFSGLLDFGRYLLRSRASPSTSGAPGKAQDDADDSNAGAD